MLTAQVADGQEVCGSVPESVPVLSSYPGVGFWWQGGLGDSSHLLVASWHVQPG